MVSWSNTSGLRAGEILVRIGVVPNLTDRLSFEAGLPYVAMAIPDLQHRLQPEFPEASANGEWQWREYYFRNAPYAMLLLADSAVGREDILNFYRPLHRG